MSSTKNVVIIKATPVTTFFLNGKGKWVDEYPDAMLFTRAEAVKKLDAFSDTDDGWYPQAVENYGLANEALLATA